MEICWRIIFIRSGLEEREVKLGFIGLGNMASAVIGGILKEGIAAPEDIIGSAKTKETAEKKAKEFGIEVCTENGKVAEQADVLVLAVKPQFFPEVISEIRDILGKETLVISVAAGKTIKYIEEQFGGSGNGLKLIRCMPNTPALVLEGCTGFCVNGYVNQEEKELAERLFCSFGKAIEVPERLMDTVGSVSGSSPAFVFMFIEDGGGRDAESTGAGICGAGGFGQRETGSGERHASGRTERYGLLPGGHDDTGRQNVGKRWYAQCGDGGGDRLRREVKKALMGYGKHEKGRRA